MSDGAIERAAPAMPTQSSSPAAASISGEGTRRNRSVRSPPWVAVASVSVAPVKSSP